jgi:hypothetical protein
MLLGEGTSSQPTMEVSPTRNLQTTSTVLAAKKTPPRKLTPKKLKIN